MEAGRFTDLAPGIVGGGGLRGIAIKDDPASLCALKVHLCKTGILSKLEKSENGVELKNQSWFFVILLDIKAFSFIIKYWQS